MEGFTEENKATYIKNVHKRFENLNRDDYSIHDGEHINIDSLHFGNSFSINISSE